MKIDTMAEDWEEARQLQRAVTVTLMAALVLLASHRLSAPANICKVVLNCIDIKEPGAYMDRLPLCWAVENNFK